MRAAGHKNNFEKFVVTFRPNVVKVGRERVLSIVEIRNFASHDSYLGLLTLVGKNRYKQLVSISNHVWKKGAG